MKTYLLILMIPLAMSCRARTQDSSQVAGGVLSPKVTVDENFNATLNIDNADKIKYRDIQATLRLSCGEIAKFGGDSKNHVSKTFRLNTTIISPSQIKLGLDRKAELKAKTRSLTNACVATVLLEISMMEDKKPMQVVKLHAFSTQGGRGSNYTAEMNKRMNGASLRIKQNLDKTTGKCALASHFTDADKNESGVIFVSSETFDCQK